MKSKFTAYSILGVLSAVYFLENYDRYLLAVSTIPYIDYSSYQYSLLSGTVFGLCYSAGGVLLALGSDAAPASSDKTMNAKIYTLTFACAIFSGAFFLTGLSSTFTQLALIRTVMGLSQSIVTPFSTGIIGECFSESARGFAFGIFQLGTYFSFSLSLSLGTYMYDEFGWKAGYLLFGTIGFFSAFAIPCLLCCANDRDRDAKGEVFDPVYAPLDSDSDGNPSSSSSSSSSAVTVTVEKTGSALVSSNLDRGSLRISRAPGGARRLGAYSNLDSLTGSEFSADEDNCSSSNQLNDVVGFIVSPSRAVSSAPSTISHQIEEEAEGEGEGGSDEGSSPGNYPDSSSQPSQGYIKASQQPSKAKESTASDCTRSNASSSTVKSSASRQVTAARSGYLRRGMSWGASSGKHSETSESTDLGDIEGRASMVSVSLLSTKGRDSELRHPYPNVEPEPEPMPWNFLVYRCACGLPSWEDMVLFKANVWRVLRDIFSAWNRQPAVYLLCLATGLRLGAGYVWSSYTSVFFSELWLVKPDGSLTGESDTCLFSYNASHTYSASSLFPGECDATYPYCVDVRDNGEFYCSKVCGTAWRNEGMSHQKLEAFMGWVPLAGSALGNVLGGLLSDRLARKWGSGGRALMCGVGNLLSIPFVVAALLSGFPGCFLFMVASGLLGELYLGQVIALLTDITPPHLIVTSVALFMFIITIIAGNAPLFIPALKGLFAARFSPAAVSFLAAGSASLSHVGSDDIPDSYSAVNEVPYTVYLDGGGARSLQWAMISVFTALYVLSGLLYMVSYLFISSRQREDVKAQS